MKKLALIILMFAVGCKEERSPILAALCCSQNGRPVCTLQREGTKALLDPVEVCAMAEREADALMLLKQRMNEKPEAE